MLNKIIELIKPFIPIKRKAIHNGAIVPTEVAPPYRIIHDYPMLPFVTVPDYPESEGGEVNAHKEYTKEGDNVIIIGGGRGVSTVNAAKEVGSTGNVTVYEGSEKYSSILKNVVELNEVSDNVEIKQCIVGPGKEIYDNSNNYDVISPKELPECDVLEMDCEGAEEEIMNNLNISPRVITVEIHPMRSDHNQTLASLSSNGYEVEAYWSNEGEKLSKEEFENTIERRLSDHSTETTPIITVTKN